MSEQSKELVPKRRFPEFDKCGGWEEVSIGRLCDTFSGGTPTSTEKSFYGGEIPFIRSAEIASDTTELYLTESGLKGSSAKMVNKGDILVALYGANSGDVAISKINGAINQAILCLQSDSEFRNRFICQYLTYKKSYIVGKYIQGGQGNLSGEIVKTIKIPQPPKISNDDLELKKIADCLSSLDDLINAQNQKVEALKQHKKGLMQQLFPAEGETVPKLRFQEFENSAPWILKRVDDVLAEKLRPIDMLDHQNYRLVTVKRRYGGVVLREVLKGELIKVKTQFLLEADDFLISKRQIVHCACGLLPKNLEGSIVSNEYSVLRVKEKNDVIFFNYFSQQPIVSSSFLECSSGIVIEKMLFKLNEWLRREFLFPNYLEQQKIANFLVSIDEIITTQTQKLEAYKTHKKGLMQQLFPALIDCNT